MNARLVLVVVLMVSVIAGGCGKNEASEKQMQATNDAKVRAEAARKEMEALPQAFRPRYNKRLEPEPTQATKTTSETKR